MPAIRPSARVRCKTIWGSPTPTHCRFFCRCAISDGIWPRSARRMTAPRATRCCCSSWSRHWRASASRCRLLFSTTGCIAGARRFCLTAWTRWRTRRCAAGCRAWWTRSPAPTPTVAMWSPAGSSATPTQRSSPRAMPRRRCAISPWMMCARSYRNGTVWSLSARWGRVLRPRPSPPVRPANCWTPSNRTTACANSRSTR